MVDKLRGKYLFKKRGVYYFSKQIPKDVRQHYSQNRIVQSLKTKSVTDTFYQSQNLLHKLNQHWFYLRVKDENILLFPYQFTQQIFQKRAQNPKLSDALKTYFKLKGKGKGEIFFRATRRAVKDVIALLKDRYLDNYSTTDAAQFRDHLLDRGLVSSTVKRVFAIIRAIINLSIQEYGLTCKNAFARTYIPDLEDSIKRQPIPIDIIRDIQKECMKIDDPNRWLIALISDTGMRLSEALGLKVSDIKLNEKIPYSNITPNPARRLKTKSSKRQIPLIGSSLWAAKQILLNVKGEFAFPHYTIKDYCYTNSASAALNKWLKTKTTKNFVIHSFRHSMRDRLRAINCPSEMIDQIGGWTSSNVGQNYGNGYSLKNSLDEMNKILDY